MRRVRLDERLAAFIQGVKVGDRVLVAIDGPDAAGKTTLAREVADRLLRPTICVSVDGWHNRREVRHRQGPDSPKGYYEDTFDYGSLLAECLEPFARGARQITTALSDYTTDAHARMVQEADPDAALLLDGVFLLRPEMRERWDLSVYLHVPESVTLARAVQRDLPLFGSRVEVQRRYEQRYLPGQAIYREDAAPMERADIVVDNSDPSEPTVLRWPTTGVPPPAGTG